MTEYIDMIPLAEALFPGSRLAKEAHERMLSATLTRRAEAARRARKRRPLGRWKRRVAE